jgi:competence ComEA-like helix-hairpin-helix protein
MKREYVKWTWMMSVLILCGMLVGTALAATLVGKTVNINTATVDDLVKNVPEMTEKMAKDIVKYRQDNGDFMQKEELLMVPGMNRNLLRKWIDFFELEGLGGKDCTC